MPKTSYANVPSPLCELETPEEVVQRELLSPAPQKTCSSSRVKATAAGLVLAAVACTLVARPTLRAHKPLRGTSEDATSQVLLASLEGEAPECSKLWDQCGGDGYEGPSCCEKGSECQDHPLDTLESYQQCRKPPPKCGSPEPGSKCQELIDGAKADSWSNPDTYHGLTGDMDDKEFQRFQHWANFESSGCPEPCADGTCYFTLHVTGCDTLDTWYCDEDDGTLKFACCCKYFHDEKSLEKPTDVDEDMANAMEAVGSTTPTLFCIAMVQPHGYELELLRAQYAKGKLGLFDCNEWALYSNESLRISPEEEKPVLKTKLINGSLDATMGGDWGTALNTDVFIRFWDRVISDPKASEYDWVVKVDPDTMWLPTRLRALLRTHYGPLSEPEPDTGLFINNCHVGLHGPIEVLSKRALQTYKDNKDECQEGEVAEIGQEDRFLHQCFLKLGVVEAQAYNLMLEATLACQEVPSAENPDKPPCFSAQVAFHPFKTIDTWLRCHGEAENHPWALPVVPVTDGPSVDNNFHG